VIIVALPVVIPLRQSVILFTYFRNYIYDDIGIIWSCRGSTRYEKYVTYFLDYIMDDLLIVSALYNDKSTDILPMQSPIKFKTVEPKILYFGTAVALPPGALRV
jgi:hypothetical protein